MYRDCRPNEPDFPAGKTLLPAIWETINAISDRHGNVALDDALADAAAAVRDRINQLNDPAQRTIYEAAIAPLARRVAPILGFDMTTTTAVGLDACMPTPASVMLEVLRRHIEQPSIPATAQQAGSAAIRRATDHAVRRRARRAS